MARAAELAAATTRPVRVALHERRHRRRIAPLLFDAAFCAAVAKNEPLPRGYGKRLSERSIEYPWLFGSRPRGIVLDAGGTLNHPWVLAALPPAVSELHVVTLAPEQRLRDPRLHYTWADLRELPIEDASIDTVACLSTLEHVGMDNRRYGVSHGRANDPQREAERAMSEMRRVLRPSGRLMLTVPFGAEMEVGSMRQMTTSTLGRCIEAFGAADLRIAVFRYRRRGWERATPTEAADACYRDRHREPVAADGAVAARAVACVELVADGDAPA